LYSSNYVGKVKTALWKPEESAAKDRKKKTPIRAGAIFLWSFAACL